MSQSRYRRCRLLGILVVVSAVIAPSLVAAPETPGFITSVVGDGNPGYSGDGGPAISAAITSPRAIHVDEVGNLYIAEGSNEAQVRKVDLGNVITTIAGPGTGGLGDGGPAVVASLGIAAGVATDLQGNLYISSWSQGRIRKVDTSGIITTIAGTGVKGFSGDGGPAIDAKLLGPGNLTFDSNGNLFFADGGRRVRMIDLNGTITTLAGNGSDSWECLRYGWDDPSICGDGGPATEAPLTVADLGVNSAGEIYISDPGHIRVRLVTPDGIISTAAGNGGYTDFYCAVATGPGTQLALYAPIGIEVDPFGSVYFAEPGLLSCIRKLTAGMLTVVAGHGRNCPALSSATCSVAAPKQSGYPALYTTLDYARHLAISKKGDVYFTEFHRVRKVVGGGGIPGVP